MTRRLVQRALLPTVLTALLTTIGCRGFHEPPFATSRALVSGRVTRGALAQPVVGLQMSVEVPFSTDCTVAARLSPTISPVATTDTDGRYAVELTLHGFGSTDVCVIVSTDGTSGRRTPVRFREVNEGAPDSVAIDIRLP